MKLAKGDEVKEDVFTSSDFFPEKNYFLDLPEKRISNVFLWNEQTTHLKVWVCDVPGMDFLGFGMARLLLSGLLQAKITYVGQIFPKYKI